MKKKIFLAAALAAVSLFAACGEPEEKPAGNNTGTNPSTVTTAPTSTPVQPTVEPTGSTPTAVPVSNTTAPATNTTAPATNTAAPVSNTTAPATNTTAPVSNTTAPAANTTAPATSTASPKPTAAPKPAETPQPVQTNGSFDAIAGNWASSANNSHGNLSLNISSDGTSSLGTLAYDGDGRYHVVGTTKTLSLEKWADGSERLYCYDTYTYEDATYSRAD